MILLLSPYQNAPECATLIERATQDKVKTIASIRLAIAALRSQDFDMVIADENLLESTPGSADSLVQRMETAVPVILDLACLRPEKVAKLVVAERKRQALQFQMAREKAVAELCSEMKSEITGLLLSSEIVLKTPDLPARASEKLNVVLEIAQRMKTRLEEKSRP